MYWAILKKAGYVADEKHLFTIAPNGKPASKFNPGFSKALRDAAYAARSISPTPPDPSSLSDLQKEMEVINKFRRENNTSPLLITASKNPTF